MQLQHNFSQRTTDIRIYDGNHRQKSARQTDEKNIKTEKDDRADQTEHLREEQETHNAGGTNFGKRKTWDKRRTDTKKGKFWCATEQ